MEFIVNPNIQVILAVMAVVAAIASAIAAWASQATARSSLNFQKRLSRHQEDLFLLRSTILSLWQLKTVLEDPLGADDDEFSAFHEVHRQITRNIESLARTGVMPRRESSFFSASSRSEIIDEMPNARDEIELEIKRLESKINEIFS